MIDRCFSTDIAAIRQQARWDMRAHAATVRHGADREAVIDVLNDVLAAEVVCWLQYHQHAMCVSGIDCDQLCTEFTEHAAAELRHAQLASARVSQLSGGPDVDPRTLADPLPLTCPAADAADLPAILTESLTTERIVICTYQEVIRWLGDGDATTRRMLESILTVQERHLAGLLSLLSTVSA